MWSLLIYGCYRYWRVWQIYIHQTDAHHPWRWILRRWQKKLHQACLSKYFHGNAVDGGCYEALKYILWRWSEPSKFNLPILFKFESCLNSVAVMHLILNCMIFFNTCMWWVVRKQRSFLRYTCFSVLREVGRSNDTFNLCIFFINSFLELTKILCLIVFFTWNILYVFLLVVCFKSYIWNKSCSN